MQAVLFLAIAVLLPTSLLSAGGGGESRPGGGTAAESPEEVRRISMVETQIVPRGVRDEKVLRAMRRVPRHEFVPPEQRSSAYVDRPLPIGRGQTISQPYIVAFMTEQLRLSGSERVLEIGTGSGYQAAVLAETAGEVFTVEIIEELGRTAAERLARLGYDSVRVKTGDGYYGWKEHAPYDGIIVTAAAGHVPPPLLDQLRPGGRLIIPIGGIFEIQSLVLIEKKDDLSVARTQLLPVRFVPLTGGPGTNP